MSQFDSLHPALQHHIVNSLGWRSLRPFQEEAISSVLAGENLIVIAPTAGGKTEAAFFPLASRMLTEEWTGLSVLYVCPIRALLNNLDTRLQRYCELLGRRSGLWHGDVGPTERRRIQRQPPDCLLTTPESLEVMLDSLTVDSVSLFANLRAMVIDEIHAFADDDRGWHLQSVLGRLQQLAGRPIQRIGLSASVGNPEFLLGWLADSCPGERRILVPDKNGGQPPSAISSSVSSSLPHVGQPPSAVSLKSPDDDRMTAGGGCPTSGATAQVQLDYVGNLGNASVVINRLHRGEKRLVFVDSRERAEKLSAHLRQHDLATFVTHSSLSADQRRQAEQAFASRENCVIVATSVLELGIDVGNLDRVIQIDSPGSVASLLQRMGRTGRRPGTTRNCLFLTTSDDSLIEAAGLIELWSRGYVEQIIPPPLPYHVFAQQVMALVLQQRGIARPDIFRWLADCPAFAPMRREDQDSIIDHMIAQDILFADGGLLSFGTQGEELYGKRHFMKLYSVFTSPPLFTVLHGRQELGFVDDLTFMGKKDGPLVLLLGGRSWVVRHVDWTRKIAHVEATQAKGHSRWKGEGKALGFALCQTIRDVLVSDSVPEFWSKRVTDRMAEVRQEYAWIDRDATTLLPGTDGKPEWWTFVGYAGNAMLAGELSRLMTGCQVTFDNFAVTFKDGATVSSAEQAIGQLRELPAESLTALVDEDAARGVKFSACVPPHLIEQMLVHRLRDEEAARRVLGQRLKVMAG